jgi:thiol-disulfide isomerase/thioredoxin
MRNKIFGKILIAGIFGLFVATSIAPSLVATDTPYTGHLRVYVVEPVSRWKDNNGEPYHFGFLGFAFNDDISIGPQDTLQKSLTWNGDVTEANVMVIAVVSNSEQHQEYASPPSDKPFKAYYTDATAAATPGNTGYNKVTTGFTHTVFVEEVTATWCSYCPAMNNALYQIYKSGDYPWYFVGLVYDMNSQAADRRDEYGISGIPTAFFDGGYKVTQGKQSSETICRPLIEACGTRQVPAFDLSVSVTYTGDGNLQITIDITNGNLVFPNESGNQPPNAGAYDTDTTSATISELLPVKMPPVANAGGPYSGVVGSEITFDGSGSNDSDGFVTSYTWYFGSGITGTDVHTTHSYTTPGNYTVTLIVTDNESLTHSNKTTVRIIPGPPKIVISINGSNIETIEEENEMTIPVTVSCYNQSVSNIHLEILEPSNLTITSLPSNITLNQGKSEELNITIKAPKLENKDNSEDKVGNETITLVAVGDSNVTSNTEQINIEVIEKGARPGFELVFALCAIAVALFLWRKKYKK